MIAMIKKKIGIINVTNNNTNGNVIEAIKNKNPESILIFIDINAKNEISKHTMK